MSVALSYVRQEHANGCGPAVLAMICGLSYAEVVAEIDAWDEPHDWDKSGTTHFTLDRFLGSRGYYWRRVCCSWSEPWPHPPFAPVHYVSVKVADRSHFVVMDVTGRVYDPYFEGRVSLAEYEGVSQVVGLVKP